MDYNTANAGKIFPPIAFNNSTYWYYINALIGIILMIVGWRLKELKMINKGNFINQSNDRIIKRYVPWHYHCS